MEPITRNLDATIRNMKLETSPTADQLKKLIREVPDFPKKGIRFYDITTLLRDKRGFAMLIDALAEHYINKDVDLVLGMEARGFIFAPALAYALGAGFVPVRKPKKLPAESARITYDLEYGTDTLEIHRDAVPPGTRVLIVDDLLATGGTAAAAGRMVRELGGEVSFDFMAVSSYGKGTDSSGEVKLIKDLDVSIEGKTIIVVEDILDTGLTLKYLLRLFEERKPKHLRVVVLLDKVERRIADVRAGAISGAPFGPGKADQPAHRLRYHVKARAVGIGARAGSRVAEAANRGIDQRGLAFMKLLIVKAEAVHRPRPGLFDQGIGAID